VLILGESGTGKELVARAVHSSSPRKNRPFTMERCVLPYVPLYNGASGLSPYRRRQLCRGAKRSYATFAGFDCPAGVFLASFRSCAAGARPAPLADIVAALAGFAPVVVLGKELPVPR